MFYLESKFESFSEVIYKGSNRQLAKHSYKRLESVKAVKKIEAISEIRMFSHYTKTIALAKIARTKASYDTMIKLLAILPILLTLVVFVAANSFPGGNVSYQVRLYISILIVTVGFIGYMLLFLRDIVVSLEFLERIILSKE